MANQAWQITSPSNLSLITLSNSIPQPGPKQVLIRISAVSLNFRDLLVAAHSPAYPLSHKTNLIPCSDAAGIVDQAGEGSQWRKGDQVVPTANTWLDGDSRNNKFDKVLGGGNEDGTLRRWIVLNDERLVRLPRNLSLFEGATLFTAGLTAFRGLFFNTIVAGPGTTVLTQGTGGVSCFGIQKLEIARKLGATHTINYRTTPDWAAEVLKLTDGKGVDLVLEVGGAATIKQSLKATRQDGLVVVVGLLTESTPTDLIPEILFGNRTVTGNVGAGNIVMFEALVDFVEKHDIHPIIAKNFEFEAAKEAFEYTTNLSEVGKVVIKS